MKQKTKDNLVEFISKLKNEINCSYYYKDESNRNIKLELRKKIEQILRKKELNKKVAESDIEEIKRLKEKLHKFNNQKLYKKIHKNSSKDINLLLKAHGDSKCFYSLKQLLIIQKELGNFNEGYNINFNPNKIINLFDQIEGKLTTVSALKKYDEIKLKQIILKLRKLRSRVVELINGDKIEQFLQLIDIFKVKLVELSSNQRDIDSKGNEQKDLAKSSKKIWKIVINDVHNDESNISNKSSDFSKDMIKLISYSPFKKFLELKVEQVIYDIIDELKGTNDESLMDNKNRKIKQIILHKDELLKEINKRLNLKISKKDYNSLLKDISTNHLNYENDWTDLNFLEDKELVNGGDLLLVQGDYVIYYY